MDTLKTAVIVVLLLAVVYGAYIVLSKPDAPMPQEIAWHDQKASEPLQIDLGKGDQQPSTASPDTTTNKFDSMWSGATKSNEPKPLASTDLTSAASSESNNVPKPSAAGPSLQAASAAVDAVKGTTDAKSTSTSDASSVAAPNLLGSDSRDATSETAPSSKNLTNSGLPSLPELRSTPGDNSPPNAPTGSATTSQDDSIARRDATFPSKENSGTQAGDHNSTPASNLPLGTPDPALGPITENSAGSESGKSVTTSAVYEAAIREAQLQIDEEKWQLALFTLSKFIGSPDLTSEQNSQLYDLLDPLAAKVVYSLEHLVEGAYEVRRGDRLADIAQTYQIPWELLANINGIENPDFLVPGTKLKVVRGPFRAEVNLQTSELTLFAGQLYAGRFPITVGKDPEPKPGEYRVLEKQPGRVYYAGDGRTIAAEDPNNPYGRIWLGLGNELSIHSSPEGGEARGLGCISLSPLDANDVYSILSQGSSVVIRR